MSAIVVPHLPNEALRERIFELALAGRTSTSIGKILDCDPSLVRAVMRDPAFKMRVAELRAEVIEATKSRLHDSAELAVLQLRAVLAGKVKGTGASAVVRASEAVLDRIGLTRAATADAARSPEAERLVAVLIQVISKHPDVNAEAIAAIEATVADPDAA